MIYKLRDYQQQASDKAVSFFQSKTKKNAIMVLPTGSGKSLIIADIANRLTGYTLVFQPSKEILEQNFKKLCSYGVFDCSIYSASFNSKQISRITFATIGSVRNHPELFSHFQNILIDECFPYNQYISTERGKLKIGYLCKLFNSGKELPRVLSYDESNNSLVPNKIAYIKNNGVKDVFKLKFNESLTIKATANHPFLTLNGWKSAQDLKVGEPVLSASPNSSHLKMPNQDQIDFLLGSLIGDGSIDKTRKTINANRFRFIHGEDQREYLKWKAGLLGCEDKVQRIEHNGFANKPAYRFTTEVLYMKDCMCSKKYAIENLTLKSLAIIYMDDGSLGLEQNQGTICCIAESEKLTSLFVSKLKEMGIKCRVSKAKSSLTKKEYNYVRLSSQGVKELSRLIAPYVHPSMKYKLVAKYRNKAGSYTWNNSFNKLGCSVFLGKEYLGKKEVYNMEVENTHTYIVTSSRYNKDHKDFDNGLIVHNCHLVNPKQGMYKTFFEHLNCKILGLTATPYRLASNSFGSTLRFITRTRPRIFSDVIYQVQVRTLLNQGFLAELQYFQLDVMDERNLKLNSTGADYTDKSVLQEFERIDFYSFLVTTIQRLLNPHSGRKPKGILVFTRFIKEAERLTYSIPSCAIVSGETPKKVREDILERFKSGEIKVVANVGVLTTGFDYPELDTIVLARPTMSLALYYQMVGRAIRPCKGKDGWIVDLCGTYKRFGKVEDLVLKEPKTGQWQIESQGKQLTNTYY